MYQPLNTHFYKLLRFFSLWLYLLTISSSGFTHSAYAEQYFSHEDELFIEEVLNSHALENSPFEPFLKPSSNQHNIISNSLSALHKSQPVTFYAYLANRIIFSNLQGDTQLSDLIKSKADFNPVQFQVYLEMIAQA
ncbi:MAG: hypothetical protein ACPGEF_07140, partial [Endozoicomonas sp.]